jgi:hypothetical protein
MGSITMELSKLSGSDDLFERPLLDDTIADYDEGHRALVVENQNLIKNGNNHFQNAIFARSDLLSILNLGPNCTDLMFSSIAAKNKLSNESESTASVIGANICDKFLYVDKKVFIANNTNLQLDYSRVSNFDRNSKLLRIHNNVKQPNCNNSRIISSRNFNWIPNNKNHDRDLKKWIDESFNGVNDLIKNGSTDITTKERFKNPPLVLGVFFKRELIEGFLNNTNYNYIALLPAALQVKWQSGQKWEFPIVTYILAPLKEENAKYFIINPEYSKSMLRDYEGFPISDTTWPERWEK